MANIHLMGIKRKYDDMLQEQYFTLEYDDSILAHKYFRLMRMVSIVSGLARIQYGP